MGYRIYRDGTEVATASTTTHTDTGLSAATAYSYAVAAYDATGNESGQSPPASATTFSQTQPDPPTGLYLY